MKYSYEFKIQCVEAYKEFGTIPIPAGVNPKSFKDKVRIWVRLYETHGPEVLRHGAQNREWNAEKRMKIVAEVLAGNSIKNTAIQYGISDGQLYQWVRKYQSVGYNGLADKPKGRKRKRSPMKKDKTHSKCLTPSEKEELILLRAKTKALEAEIAAIKKERALRLERWEKALKAKKQKSSRNSEAKDMN